MTLVVAGGVIEKDGRYLLVQESGKSKGKEDVAGKWALPAGKVENGEMIFAGAKREVKEECEFDVELTGICFIGNFDSEHGDGKMLMIIFTTEIIGGEVKVGGDEILDAKWFSHEEILAMTEAGQIRKPEVMLAAIENAHRGKTYPLDTITVIN